MKTIVHFLFILLTTVSFSQEKPVVTVAIDTAQIRIGEQLIYQIAIDKKDAVVLPKTLENLHGLEVVHTLKTDTLQEQLIQKYVLTGFDSGAYYIPSQQIFIRNQSYKTDSLLVSVATVTVDTLQQKMFPIKGHQEEPYIFDDYKRYIYWGIAVLLLLLVIVYFFRKKQQEETVVQTLKIPAYEEALQKLSALDTKLLWQNNQTKAYYSELTEILRNYIERDIEIPTFEMTSSEIIELIRAQNTRKKLDVSAATIEGIHTVLQHADLVKFAKQQPLSDAIKNDRKETEKLIEKIQEKVTACKIRLQEAAEQSAIKTTTDVD